MSSPRSVQPLALAVDAGGTKLSMAVVSSEGTVLSRLKFPIEKTSLEKSILQIVDLTRQTLELASATWEQISGVGMVIPGIYFSGTGMAWAPNLWGWDRVPLLRELQSRIPVAVQIDSDRTGYVLGEQWLGVAAGLSEVAFMAVGTGIGLGILIGGKPYTGAEGIAGAIGWFAVDPRQKEIYQQVGCMEAEGAGPAVARKAAAHLAAGAVSFLQAQFPSNPEAVTTEAVVEAARQGDALALQVLDEVAKYLAMGVANVISLLNPQMVVLGGGLMQAAGLIFEPLRRGVRLWAQPVAMQSTRIELSRLGEDAGLMGAARLVFLGAC